MSHSLIIELASYAWEMGWTGRGLALRSCLSKISQCLWNQGLTRSFRARSQNRQWWIMRQSRSKISIHERANRQGRQATSRVRRGVSVRLKLIPPIQSQKLLDAKGRKCIRSSRAPGASESSSWKPLSESATGAALRPSLEESSKWLS